MSTGYYHSDTDLGQLIALFAEETLLYVIRGAPRTHAELLLISILLPASVGLLFTEYRLTVPNLVASILAMLFAGAARGLWKTAIAYQPDIIVDESNHTGRYIIVGALVGVAWALVFGTGGHILALNLEHAPLLAINAVASALLGKSILLPIDDGAADAASRTVDDPVHNTWDILTLIVLTGIVGCHSTLSVRRSYTNMYQFCCFLFGITSIGIRACTKVSNTRLQNSWITSGTYELTSSSELPTEGRDSLTEEVDHFGMAASVSSARKNALRGYILVISIVSLWTAYGVMNFTERQEHQSLALLDRDYVPQSSLEIVLSMYKEPIDDVSKLVVNLKRMSALSDAQVTIYIKDSEADNAYIKQQTGADQVITLPNVGREGETFLNHILNRWQSLARQTIFLQAGIHNPREFYAHVNNYYSRSQTGFLNLGWSGAVCNCEDCGDRLSWQDDVHLFPQVYNQIYNSTTCENVLLSYKGQFIVSAARIRGLDKGIYNDLWQAFVDEKSWAHQPNYLKGRPDSMSTPDFGYTIERIWNLLFQCSNVDVAWKCPSLLSKWRIGGDISDCQCFDA